MIFSRDSPRHDCRCAIRGNFFTAIFSTFHMTHESGCVIATRLSRGAANFRCFAGALQSWELQFRFAHEPSPPSGLPRQHYGALKALVDYRTLTLNIHPELRWQVVFSMGCVKASIGSRPKYRTAFIPSSLSAGVSTGIGATLTSHVPASSRTREPSDERRLALIPARQVERAKSLQSGGPENH